MGIWNLISENNNASLKIACELQIVNSKVNGGWINPNLSAFIKKIATIINKTT